MWEKIHKKVYTGITKEAIWSVWTDVNSWPKWHDGLEYCKMQGPFVVGNHFMLKPKTMGPVKITLTEVIQGYSFTDCTTFFGAKMYDTHSIEETSEGLVLCNKLVVTGPLAWVWIKLVAQYVANSVPKKMDASVKVAKELHE